MLGFTVVPDDVYKTMCRMLHESLQHVDFKYDELTVTEQKLVSRKDYHRMLAHTSINKGVNINGD